MLTFIYNLREIDFKYSSAIETTTYSNVIPDFPLLTFKTKQSSFHISFFVKKARNSRELKPDIRLFESKSRSEIGRLTKNGNLIYKLEEFKPKLSIFFEALTNNQYKLYSGVESGICEICDRELTNPYSLRLGIGPICARNIKLNRTIYKL